MKTTDFKEMGVGELEMGDLLNTEGGMIAPLASFTVRAIVTYIKYCISIGSEYATL